MLCFCKYYLNWFTVGKVITKMAKTNFLLRHSVLCRPVPQTGPSGFYWQQPRQQDAPAGADHLLTVAPVAAAHGVAAPAQQHRSVKQGHRSVTHWHRSLTHKHSSVTHQHRSAAHWHDSFRHSDK